MNHEFHEWVHGCTFNMRPEFVPRIAGNHTQNTSKHPAVIIRRLSDILWANCQKAMSFLSQKLSEYRCRSHAC